MRAAAAAVFPGRCEATLFIEALRCSGVFFLGLLLFEKLLRLLMVGEELVEVGGLFQVARWLLLLGRDKDASLYSESDDSP